MKKTLYSLMHMERSMTIYIFMWGMGGFAWFGVQAVLLNLYMLYLGFDAPEIGRFLAIGQLCFGLAALPSGVLGARHGPRSGLLVGTGMTMVGWIVFALAESLPVGLVGLGLQVGLATANMGQASMIVNGAPYLMRITNAGNRFDYIAIQQAFQALMGVVGGLLAGALPGWLAAQAADGRSEMDFYRAALWLVPMVFGLAFAALWKTRVVMLHPPPVDETTFTGQPTRFPGGVFLIYPLIVYLAIVGDSGSRTFFNLYLYDLGLNTAQIGRVFGVNQLAPFITALLMPVLLSRLGIGRAFSLGCSLLAGVLVLISLTSGVSGATIGFFGMAMMSTVLQSTRSIFGQELVDLRWQTLISAVGTVSMALGSASSALLAGSIIPNLGFSILFRICAVLMGLASVFSLIYLVWLNRRDDSEGQGGSAGRRWKLPARPFPSLWRMIAVILLGSLLGALRVLPAQGAPMAQPGAAAFTSGSSPLPAAQIAAYQQRLWNLGYREVGPANGVFDAQSKAAVQHFQWLNGLPVDGVIDTATAARLAAPDAQGYRLPPPYSGRRLRRGMYVHPLESPLLDRLAELGYRPAGRTDRQGKFSAEDEAALRAFQRANGLPASGVVTLATWQQVFSPLARSRAAGQEGALPSAAGQGSFPPGWGSARLPLAGLAGGAPHSMASIGGQMWLTRSDGVLVGYDPLSGQPRGPLFVGDLNLEDGPVDPLGMAAIGSLLWVYWSGPEGQMLQGFDPLSGLARAPLLLDDCPGCGENRAFGFDGYRVWLAGPGSSVQAVNAISGYPLVRRTVRAAPQGTMAFDGRCLWVSLRNGQIEAVDAGLGVCAAAGQSVRLPDGALGVPRMAAPAAGLLAYASQGSRQVEWFDALSSASTRPTLTFGSPIRLLAALGGQLWVGESSGLLTRIDPAGLVPAQVTALGCVPLVVTRDAEQNVWVACEDAVVQRLAQ